MRDDVPDGPAIVWTRDRRGHPDRVRVVPRERHRRLSVYASLDVDALRDRYDGVRGVTLSPGRGGDVGLRVLVDSAGWSARRKLPPRVRRVPVEVAEHVGEPVALAGWGRSEESERGRRGRARKRGHGTGRRGAPEEPPGCDTVCDEHILPFFDPVPAGVQVKGHHDGEATLDGTLGLVAWNDDPEDPYECFVTAHHVVALAEGNGAVGGESGDSNDDGATDDSSGDAAATDFLFQSGLDGDEPRAENVGRYRAGSPLAPSGLDVAKYEVTDNVAAATLESVADAQPDLTGSWTFAGLADATAKPDGSVPVTFAGRSTCWAESRCTRTARDHALQYEAVVAPALADTGDSGGPWVDPDGKLVCTMATGPACDGVDDHHCSVAGPVLDRLGIALAPPGD